MNELMIQENQNLDLTTIDPSVAAAVEAAKQRIQCAYTIALRKPRNTDEARDKIIRECTRPSFAEKAEFSKPMGGKSITGPTARFAEVALRYWGNVLTESHVVYEDDSMRRTQVIVTDTESNTVYLKEFSLKKAIERKEKRDREVISERKNSYGELVYLVTATDEEVRAIEASLISKAIRNEGLRLIPADIVEEGLNAARKTLKDRDLRNPEDARRKLLDAFSSIGVTPIDLEGYLGHDTSKLVPKELEDLRAVYTSLKDGEATWNDYAKIEDNTPASPFKKKHTAKVPNELVEPPPPPQEQTQEEPELSSFSNFEIQEKFHKLIEKIGRANVSGYFSRAEKTTLTLVKQDFQRMINIIESPESFVSAVNDFIALEESLSEIQDAGS